MTHPLDEIRDAMAEAWNHEPQRIYLDGELAWERGRGRIAPLDKFHGIKSLMGIRIDLDMGKPGGR